MVGNLSVQMSFKYRKNDKKHDMRSKKVKVENLKYAVLDKENMEISIFRFKNEVANKIKVSIRTLERTFPYENERFIACKVANVV